MYSNCKIKTFDFLNTESIISNKLGEMIKMDNHDNNELCVDYLNYHIALTNDKFQEIARKLQESLLFKKDIKLTEKEAKEITSHIFGFDSYGTFQEANRQEFEKHMAKLQVYFRPEQESLLNISADSYCVGKIRGHRNMYINNLESAYFIGKNSLDKVSLSYIEQCIKNNHGLIYFSDEKDVAPNIYYSIRSLAAKHNRRIILLNDVPRYMDMNESKYYINPFNQVSREVLNNLLFSLIKERTVDWKEKYLERDKTFTSIVAGLVFFFHEKDKAPITFDLILESLKFKTLMKYYTKNSGLPLELNQKIISYLDEIGFAEIRVAQNNHSYIQMRLEMKLKELQIMYKNFFDSTNKKEFNFLESLKENDIVVVQLPNEKLDKINVFNFIYEPFKNAMGHYANYIQKINKNNLIIFDNMSHKIDTEFILNDLQRTSALFFDNKINEKTLLQCKHKFFFKGLPNLIKYVEDYNKINDFEEDFAIYQNEATNFFIQAKMEELQSGLSILEYYI